MRITFNANSEYCARKARILLVACKFLCDLIFPIPSAAFINSASPATHTHHWNYPRLFGEPKLLFFQLLVPLCVTCCTFGLEYTTFVHRPLDLAQVSLCGKLFLTP